MRGSVMSDLIGTAVLFLIALVIISCGVQNDTQNTGDSYDSRQVLRVGMELAYPPFEMTGTDGKPSGVSVDLAKALGKDLDRPVEITNIEFSGLIESLRSGKIDCIISSMTATDERRNAIDFSDAYVRTGLCLLVSKESNKDVAGFKSISDLDNAETTIAVKNGTTGHIYAMKHLKSARVLVLEKEDACVLEVVQGKADAFIYDQMSVYRHWQRHPESTSPVLKPFQTEVWSVGLRKGDEDLKTATNQFLESFAADGGFDRLADKYLPEEKKAFAENGFPFLFQVASGN